MSKKPQQQQGSNNNNTKNAAVSNNEELDEEDDEIMVHEKAMLEGPVEQEFILDENDEQPPSDDDDDDNWEDDVDGDDIDENNAIDDANAELGDAAEDEVIVNDSVASYELHTDSLYKLAAFQAKENKSEVLVACASGDDSASIFKIKKSTAATQQPATSSGSSSDAENQQQQQQQVVEIEKLHHLKGHTDSVIDVAFSADGKFVATGSMDATVRIWNSSTGELVNNLEGPGADIEWIEWHPKSYGILCGTAEATAWAWRADTGACVNVYAGHAETVSCGCFTADGKKILTGSEDSTVRVWEIISGHCVHTFQGAQFSKEPIVSIKSRPQDPIVFAAGSMEGTVRMANIESKKVIATYTAHDSAVECIDFCSIMPLVGAAGSDAKLSLYDITTMQVRSTMSHQEGVIKIRFDATRPLIYSSSADKTLCIWDIRTGQVVKTLRGHKDMVLDFAHFSLDDCGEFLVSCSDDTRALVFKL